MNVSELARRLRVTPHELLSKLPELGFDIGTRAIKVDDRVADQIFKKWIEAARRERLRNQLIGGPSQGPAAAVKKTDVVLPSVMTVRDFAGALNLPVTKVIQQLMKAGILASQNERIDFTTAAIISAPVTARLARNIGFVTEASGTATVPSDATSIVVTHGCSILPFARDISVTPANNMGAATKFWVSSVTVTEFTINVDVAPGGSGATFAWQTERRV